MSEPTYKEIDRAKSSVTLLVFPGTDAQRATFTCQADRADQRANALTKTRAKHGATVPMAWRLYDGKMVEVR